MMCMCLSKERESWRPKLKAVLSLAISFYLKTRWQNKEGENQMKVEIILHTFARKVARTS